MFVSDVNSVGKFGFTVAQYSKEYLGYLAFVYLPLLIIPIYKINFSYIDRYIEKTISLLFLFVTLVTFQALVVETELTGQIGIIIIDSMSPYIGIAGVWIFVLISLFISLIILFEQNGEEIYKKFVDYKNGLSLDINIKPKTSRKLPKKLQKKVEPKVVVQEIGDTAEIRIEEESKPIQFNIDNTYMQEPNIIKEDIKKEEKIDRIEDIEIVQKVIKEPIVATEPIEEDILYKNIDIKEDIPSPSISTSTHNIVDELEENKKLLEDIEVGDVIIPKDFQLPPTNIFQKAPQEIKSKINEAVIDRQINDLLEKLKMFKIEGDVVRTYTGPIVTTFEFKPAPNVKVSKILNLQDDLAMALKAQTIRIQAPIPGKDVVGIEVPNDEAQTIYIREILESELFSKASSPLTIILGKDIVGNPFITDLKKLPHLLIAGTTGSGKSVGLNSMILSLLYKNSPDNLKLIMIDPKMIEFSIYNDIPHLLTPVITKPMEAINALANMVAEMERRYCLMADTRTKNIENYNEKSKTHSYEPFPYIVIIIDELADLMMTSGKEVEISIARIAQKARACGIHLVVATQRPSVDVVTGLIKANLPSRISYKVGQKVDSKIILDSMGAESLLGRGDMLFTPPGMSGLVRVHAPWSDETEIEAVADFLKDQREASYDVSILKDVNTEEGFTSGELPSGDVGVLDELYESAKLVVIQDKKSSISYLQRRLKIGYNRSATIIEQLEKTGVLSSANAKGNREILI